MTLIGTVTGRYPSRWVSVAVQLGVALLAYAKLRDAGLAGLLLASALALCATFLTGWQAFVNYYYVVGMMLLLVAMIFAAPNPVMHGARGSADEVRAGV